MARGGGQIPSLRGSGRGQVGRTGTRREVGAQCLSWGWGSKLSSGVVGVQGVRPGITRSGQASWARLVEDNFLASGLPQCTPTTPTAPRCQEKPVLLLPEALGPDAGPQRFPFCLFAFCGASLGSTRFLSAPLNPGAPRTPSPKSPQLVRLLWAFFSVPCSLGLFKRPGFLERRSRPG